MRRPLLAEELPAHIVVDPHNLPAFRGKLADAFRADQSAGSSDKSLHSQDPLYYYACLHGKPDARSRSSVWAAQGFPAAVRTKTYSLQPNDPPQVVKRVKVKPRRK